MTEAIPLDWGAQIIATNATKHEADECTHRVREQWQAFQAKNPFLGGI